MNIKLEIQLYYGSDVVGGFDNWQAVVNFIFDNYRQRKEKPLTAYCHTLKTAYRYSFDSLDGNLIADYCPLEA